jgi:hypothetical protein
MLPAVGEQSQMGKKKDKKLKANDPITVRLEFTDQLKVDFEDFRFGNRYASNKDAALSLIQDGLAAWKQKRDHRPVQEAASSDLAKQ